MNELRNADFRMRNSEFRNPNSELIDFMVANAVYPMWSKNGKVFLRASKKGLLTEERKREIIHQLDIKTFSECQKLREEIRKQVAERKVNRPIKEWVEEERPKESVKMKMISTVLQKKEK